LNEEDFRRSIENRLREDRAGAAIARLRTLLAPYVGLGQILPERFLTIDSVDLVLGGWEVLGEAIGQYDRPGRPVTALSIAFGWPGDNGPQPDAAGCFRPHIETSYFNDDAYPFSQCGREDLLDGYSYYGCNWAGDAEATDAALSLDGIDDLHTALAALEARLLASVEPDEDGIRAGSLASCLLSVLLFQAVSEQIARNGLPRPLCITAGSNGVYPYFDAPVAGMPEDARLAAEAQLDVIEVGQAVPAPRYSSLLMTEIPRAKKRAVLVLDESEEELADRIAGLRSINHAQGEDPETQGEDPETRGEALPATLAPELVEAASLALCNEPLLAKKPDRGASDIREMPGQPETWAPTMEPAPSGRPVGFEPTLRATGKETPPRPGSAPLEPAPPVQESQHIPPRPSGLRRVKNAHAATLPDGRPTEAMPLPILARLLSRLRAWLWRRGPRS
jgi:hypothetical protein